MRLQLNRANPRAERSSAFTLLEVIVACSLFFMVAFAVLEIVAIGLVAAKKLQRREPQFECLTSPHVLTNILNEGNYSGSFDELNPALSDLYPGFSWEYEIVEIGSNGLFRVDYAIFDNTAKSAKPRTLTTHFYKPASPPGSATKASR
jgi:hypothetical protein